MYAFGIALGCVKILLMRACLQYTQRAAETACEQRRAYVLIWLSAASLFVVEKRLA